MSERPLGGAVDLELREPVYEKSLTMVLSDIEHRTDMKRGSNS